MKVFIKKWSFTFHEKERQIPPDDFYRDLQLYYYRL